MNYPMAVIDIELSLPIKELSGFNRYKAVKCLLRWHGIPIGYLDMPLTEGSCTAATLSKAIVGNYSWAILCHLAGEGLKESKGDALSVLSLTKTPQPVYSGPLPSVTVAVCTRDRPEDLAICLDALCRIDYSRLDILVVDNAPTSDATERLIRRNYHEVRYVCEPRPGLNWARNRAIREARGEIISYTDDDVVVDAGWVKALAEVFAANSEVMAVTGLVVPYELETEAQVLFEQYGGFGRGFESKWYRVNGASNGRTASLYGWAGMFGTGANMAFRRILFEQVGDFDPALDVGTVTNGGGDIEMFFRILHKGYTLVYEPRAIVRHCHRRDYTSLRKQIANNGIGFSAYLVRSALAYPEERLAIIRFWLSWLTTWHLPRMWKSLRGKEPFPRDLIAAELLGYLVGLGRYIRARKRATEIEHDFNNYLTPAQFSEV